MTRQRRIRVKGVRRAGEAVDIEQAALVYWLLAKAEVRRRREQEQRAKDKERQRER